MKKIFKLRKNNLMLITAVLFVIAALMPTRLVKAEELKEVNIRVEGLEGTLAEGREKGKTAYEVLEKLLKNQGVNYSFKDSQYGKYMESIGEIKAGKFGGWDGWLYYIKNGGMVQSAVTSIDQYELKEGDNIIVYYGNFDTPYVNSIKFYPEVVKENEEFIMEFAFTSFDFVSNKEVTLPIKNAQVIIDNQTLKTDEKGKVKVAGLVKGTHSYKIFGYAKDGISSVIMDKGTFTFDNENKTQVYFSDFKYNENDNLNVSKNIEKEIHSTLGYLKSNSNDPWVAMSLSKLNVKGEEDFVKKWAEELEVKTLKDLMPSELVTRIIGVVAAGYNPYDFQGKDLVKELFTRDIEEFYNNEIVFSLFAYNYAKVGDKYHTAEANLVNALLKNKLSYEVDGKRVNGWTWFGDKVDPDITAAVLSALSPYYNGRVVKGVDNAAVKVALDEGVKTLSLMQKEDGDIIGQYGPASETNSFTIIGLVSLGIDPQGGLFTKSKGDLVSALLSYKGDNGMFNHDNSIKNNGLSTEQAMRALISLKEFNTMGKYNFYDNSREVEKLPKYKLTKPVDTEDKTINENKDTTAVLPKTGSIANTKSLVISSIGLIVLGSILVMRKK